MNTPDESNAVRQERLVIKKDFLFVFHAHPVQPCATVPNCRNGFDSTLPGFDSHGGVSGAGEKRRRVGCGYAGIAFRAGAQYPPF